MTRKEFERRILQAGNGVVTITEPEVIRAAWGSRRTSNKRRGMDVKAYPPKVTASVRLWLQWFDAAPQGEVVVIAKKKAQARIEASLAHLDQGEAAPKEKLADDDVQALLSRRMELRASKDFAEADKIRDYLVSVGVTVSDEAVG